MKKLSPIHPGEILSAEFIEAKGMSQSQLARAINVPPAGSTRSASGSAGSLPTPPFASSGTSASAPSSG